MSGEDREKESLENVYRFSVWKTNIALTVLSVLEVVLLDLISEDKPLAPRTVERLMGVRIVDLGVFPGLALILSIVAAAILVYTVFTYLSWNNVVARFAGCKKITLGQSYAVVLVIAFLFEEIGR
ncbi:MAG TPA: hypothetical protein VM285_04415 [Polyangia bacterium]|nr:hypothetical protein [Polyangia bacterium]